MAIGQPNPTRMELTKLKNQLATAKRGHKLLKDKQDEMVRQFMLIVRENKSLREKVEKELSLIMEIFENSKNQSSRKTIIESLLVPSRSLNLEEGVNYVMNLEIPTLEVDASNKIELTYSFYNSPVELDDSLLRLAKLLPDILRLAELDKTTSMLSREIEKTRRRVNAIEYVMIPNMEEQIHTIRMKLEDDERSNIVRLMKSKEIIMGNEEKKNK